MFPANWRRRVKARVPEREQTPDADASLYRSRAETRLHGSDALPPVDDPTGSFARGARRVRQDAGERLSAASHAEHGAALALIAMAVGAFLLHAHYLAREPVDDAGISVAYARSVAEGAGFRVTPESAVAEGFSNPSWTLILIALELLGLDSLTWVKPLGLALSALALALVALWGPVIQRRRLQVEDALGPWIAAAHPSFVHWAQGGLEMGLALFGIGLLGVFAFGPHTPGRARAAGLSFALVALTRPEGALYAAAVGVAWPLMMCLRRRRPARMDLEGALCAVVPLLAYVAFRRLYFGAWVPNTYLAKHSWDYLNGELYFTSFWQSYRALSIATLWALPFAALGGARSLVRGFACGALLAAFAYFTYHAQGDWMREWRFLAPAALFQGAGIACGVSGLRHGVQHALAAFERLRPQAQHVQQGVAAALIVHIACQLLPTELARSEAVRVGGYDVPIRIAKGAPFDAAEESLTPFKMAHPLVLASDMGVIALGLRQGELWDFGGLTDPAMARYYGRYLAFEDYMTHEGPPSMVLSSGPGNFFLAAAYARDRYVQVSFRRFLLKGLTAEEDPRCPGGKHALLATPPHQLTAQIREEIETGEPVRALARWRCAYTYHPDAQLPSLATRAALARLAADIGDRHRGTSRSELRLRYYSFCAVIGMKETRLTVRCRRKAEAIRAMLFPPPAPPP